MATREIWDKEIRRVTKSKIRFLKLTREIYLVSRIYLLRSSNVNFRKLIKSCVSSAGQEENFSHTTQLVSRNDDVILKKIEVLFINDLFELTIWIPKM